MRRTWVAVTAVMFLALTAAAFIKGPANTRAAIEKRIAPLLSKFNAIVSSVSGSLPAPTSRAASRKERSRLQPSSTRTAQTPRAQVGEDEVQKQVVRGAATYAIKRADAGNRVAADSTASSTALAYSDRYLSCVVEDNYDEGETTCYVDSVNGNDANDGLSAASPVSSVKRTAPKRPQFLSIR